MGQAALNNSLLDFMEDMNRVASVDTAWETTVAYMRGLGANNIGNLLDTRESGLIHQSTSSPRVIDIYREFVYPDHDPKREHCRNNVTPYFFGKEFWYRESNLTDGRRWCDEELADAGDRAMVAIPVHMPLSQDWGHLSISANCRRDEFVKFYRDRGSAIQLGAITAFNRIYTLVKDERAGRIGITKRERECLLWLARGLRNESIAERMNIRQVTVEFHLANARRKLNARTRGQALIKAVQLGLIEP